MQWRGSVLADETGYLALFTLGDVPRAGARQVARDLEARGLSVCLLSGDRRRAVSHFAREFGIATAVGEADPAAKLAFVRELQSRGAVVAMVGDEIKQTRCSTCDADHEYKHARVPKPRRKTEPAALSAQVPAAPKRVVHGGMPGSEAEADDHQVSAPEPVPDAVTPEEQAAPLAAAPAAGEHQPPSDEGPVHRTLIRAQLPRGEGQPPPARPAPARVPADPAAAGRTATPSARPASGSGPALDGSRTP